MAINRAAHGKLMRLGLRTHFGLKYNQVPMEMEQVFETRASTQAYEEDVNLFGTGWAIVKGEGQQISFDTVGQGYTSRYVHETLALGVEITEEAVEDNLYLRMLPQLGSGLADSLKITQDVRAINVLNNATSGSHLGGDGQPLLSTSHPLTGPGGGTFSNTLAAQAQISEASIEELLINLRYAKNDRGLPIVVKPVRLVASAALEFELERILGSVGRVGTADNDTNAIKARGYFSGGPILLRHLTNHNLWGIKTDVPNGLIHFTRRALRQKNSDDFKSGNHMFKVDARDSNGWTDPRGFYGSDPA
jgi:hypothetical protein